MPGIGQRIILTLQRYEVDGAKKLKKPTKESVRMEYILNYLCC